MTRQAIETRTRLLIALDIIEKVVKQDNALQPMHFDMVRDAFYSISRAAASLELPND